MGSCQLFGEWAIEEVLVSGRPSPELRDRKEDC